MPNICKYKKLYSDSIIPTRGSKKAAGYDLYAHTTSETIILPHQSVIFGTGIALQPPDGYFTLIVARSGIASKRGLRPSNCVGVCDEDYTGEYFISVHNDTAYPQSIESGERIAQLVFLPYISAVMIEGELSKTERGSNGFGSTGK